MVGCASSAGFAQFGLFIVKRACALSSLLLQGALYTSETAQLARVMWQVSVVHTYAGASDRLLRSRVSGRALFPFLLSKEHCV